MTAINRIVLGAAALACATSWSAAQARAGAHGATKEVEKEVKVVPYILGDGGSIQVSAGDKYTSTSLWDNGDDDRVVAILSTVNQHADSQAADDCWLKEGMWYDIQTVTVRMAVTTGFEPQTLLYGYEDCDGRPDDTLMPAVYPQDEWYVVDSNPGGDFAGTQIWEIVYHVDEFVRGPQLGWLSPVHYGQGLAFWVSATTARCRAPGPSSAPPTSGCPTGPTPPTSSAAASAPITT
ncbi:MAG: hypothetical protein R3B49_02635 [Phycisphaerales bacterium]